MNPPPHPPHRPPDPPSVAGPRSLRPWLPAFWTILALNLGSAAHSGEGSSWPPLADVASRIRAVLSSAPEPGASETNASNYVRSLAPWVLIGAETPATQPLILRSNVYPEQVGYLRVGSVASGLREAIDGALDSLGRTNVLTGLVLDLRFAGGTDFASAASAAGAFSARSAEVFSLGQQKWRAEAGSTSRGLPVVVLINRQTRGGAEALAAAIRALASPVLLVGTNTAGQARVYRPLNLTPDLSLRIADESLALPGGASFPAEGLAADLNVEVSEADERQYYTNEFQRVQNARPIAATDPFRLNEAELVRRRRNPNLRPDSIRAQAASVQDPVLATAIDILGGRAKELAAQSEGDSR